MRRTALRRRTPLRTRSTPKRTSWLRSATTWLKRHVRLRAKGGARFPDRRDDAYRVHVRELRCLLEDSLCLGPIDPHHVVKKSQGGGDHDNLVPLCRWHHDLVETTPKSDWRRRYPDLDLAAAAHRIWTAYQEQAA